MDDNQNRLLVLDAFKTNPINLNFKLNQELLQIIH